MTKTMRTLLILNSIWMILCAGFFALMAMSTILDFSMGPTFPKRMIFWGSLATAIFLIVFATHQFEKIRPIMAIILIIFYFFSLFSWFCYLVSDAYSDLWWQAITKEEVTTKNNLLSLVFPGMYRLSLLHALLLIPPVYVNIIHPKVQARRLTSIASAQLTAE